MWELKRRHAELCSTGAKKQVILPTFRSNKCECAVRPVNENYSHRPSHHRSRGHTWLPSWLHVGDGPQYHCKHKTLYNSQFALVPQKSQIILIRKTIN